MLQQTRIKNIFLIFICALAAACGERAGNDAVEPGDTSGDDDPASTSGATDPDNEDEEIVDNCPDNPDKTDPGFCGCGVPEGTCCETINNGSVKAIGAKYAFYAQAYSDDLDLDSLVPDDEKIVQIVRDQTIEPAGAQESFVILNGYIKIEEAGLYSYSPGYEQSTFNVMTVDDQEVHRKDLGDTDGVTTEIYLAEGYHRFRIVFFKTINPLAIWQNDSRMNENHLWHDEPFSKDKEDGILGTLRALGDHINEDYENGIEWSKHGTPGDTITLRLSEKAKVDLRPLLHFWGIHPEDPDALAADIAASKLPPSAKIYDALAHYKSLVPKDNSAFQAFALSWWGKQPSVDGYWTEREHARQWDSTTYLDRWPEPARPNGEMYNEATAADIRNRVQEIMDLYFPKGRP